MTTTPEGPDPLTVPCPDCEAPTGTACYHSTGSGWPEGYHHADRIRSVTLRNVERGLCALCQQPMVRLPDGDAWHPVGTLTTPCPQLPDPQTDWNAYAALINTGIEPGRPGRQHFIPAPPPRRVLCPECTNGKVQNCAQQALQGDDLIPCANAGGPHQ